jgi:hypothetical protein
VVEQALDHFHEVIWLGQYSPLASPYFLGERLLKATTEPDVLQCGHCVQQLLLAAADELPQQSARWGQRWRDLLQESYFNPTTLPVHRIIPKLHLAEATYHRQRNAAVQQLGQAIIRLVKPALRLEPVAPPPCWWAARRRWRVSSLAWLRAKRSV